MAETYTPVHGSERIPLAGAIATGAANAHATIEVSLKLRRMKPLPALHARPQVLLSRAQLASAHGAATADIDAVTQAFGRLGLKSVGSNQATRTVRLCGTVAAMESAFHVKLFSYAHESGSYRGRVGPVRVPSAMKDIVQGVFGLDNRRVARQRRQPPSENAHIRLGSVPSAWYVPQELARHYNFPAGDGAGQTIGLLEFGGGYFPADLKKFCTLAKIATPPTVTVISTDGSPTDLHDGTEAEVMLDVEVIAGACPKAHIAVYFAQWDEQGWLTALDTAVHDQTNDPGVLSISWGNAEDSGIWTGQAMSQLNETLQEAALLGITVCVAAGDDGSSDAVMDGHAHVDFPASSPYVLAVGGTTIPVKGGPQPDIGWKEGDGLRADNGGSTGGGTSAVFARPAWQNGINVKPVNPGAIVGRCIPDIAANADWNASPYLLVVDGKSVPSGGTSAAAPLVASLLALINAKRAASSGHRVGYVTPVLYQANGGATVGAASCTDITIGNNVTDRIGGYTAGMGYDAVTGWGTPNGAKLAAALPA